VTQIRLPDPLDVIEPTGHYEVRYADDVIRMVVGDEQGTEFG
jgi:hypothetical protein